MDTLVAKMMKDQGLSEVLPFSFLFLFLMMPTVG
jgi:hypothetical protein